MGGALTGVVYYLGFQFGWETPEISVFSSVVNIFRVSALVIILPSLNYLVRTRRANRQRRESGFAVPQPNTGSDSLDLAIIRVAVVCEVIGFAGYAAARTPALFVLSGIIASLGGVGSPTLQSALTKHVPHDRVGQLLGATGLLHALARVVCPLVFNLIYASSGHVPTDCVCGIDGLFRGGFGVQLVYSTECLPRRPDNIEHGITTRRHRSRCSRRRGNHQYLIPRSSCFHTLPFSRRRII